MNLDRETAEELLYNDEFEGYKVVDRSGAENHRWYTRRRVVFTHEKYSTSFYAFYWDDPATEMQEDLDYFNDAEEVHIFEVWPKQVTITTYDTNKT